jgi:rubrerythrin
MQIGNKRVRRRLIRADIRSESQAAKDYTKLERVVSKKEKPVIREIKLDERDHKRKLEKLIKADE